jgi:hypothetical protein
MSPSRVRRLARAWQAKHPTAPECRPAKSSASVGVAELSIGDHARAPLPAALVCRGYRRLDCREGQQRPAADIHLLQGSRRPSISRKVIEPQCRTTDRDRHRKAAGAFAEAVN